MKHTALYRLLPIICLLLLLVGIATQAQQAEVNLLTNPGFEETFVNFDGIQPRNVGSGWVPWHIPQSANMREFENIQPKYDQVAPDSSRVRNGSNAQMYYSFYETHDGGLYQQVNGITSGTEVRFSIYAYVWSTNFDDRNLSEDDGNVQVNVGIDPTGGTNPTSDDIVWSPQGEFYDTYRQYSVIATAESTTVTVWVRSVMDDPVRYTYIYLDDAVLAATTDSGQTGETEESAETEEPPTDTPTATSTATNTSTATATSTDVPEEPSDTPTATSTNTATPTNTVQVPTFTTVPDEPTDTPTATSTNTATPTNTVQVPTFTTVPDDEDPTPTLEDFDGPIPTNTPTLTSTPTDVPATGGEGSFRDRFPANIVHSVRSGQTIEQIAALYGSESSAIREANGLNQNALIYVGQGLVVPVRLSPQLEPTRESGFVVTGSTATPLPRPIVPPNNDTVFYKVQSGDNLSLIANRFNTTVSAIVQLNNIVNQNRINVGEVLVVPTPRNTNLGQGGALEAATSPPIVQQPTATPEPPVVRTHVIVPGENLYRISLRYNVSLRELIELNNIANPSLIFTGQVLILPSQ